jgi:hypothetical protein
MIPENKINESDNESLVKEDEVVKRMPSYQRGSNSFVDGFIDPDVPDTGLIGLIDWPLSI